MSGQKMIPPILSFPDYPLSPYAQSILNQTWLVVIVATSALLFWDWACEFNREYRLIHKPTGDGISSLAPSGPHSVGPWYHPGRRCISRSFLISRYVALVNALFFLLVFCLAKNSEGACEAMRALPFTFSVVNLAAHIVMTLRVYGLSGQNRIIGLFFTFWTLFDFLVEVVADTFIQPIYLALPAPGTHLCYIEPSSWWFAWAFLAPTLLHHMFLVYTLYKSHQHLEAEKMLGGGSVVRTLREDQILYVLAICLINFANVILVLQNKSKAYRLIWYLPSMAFTQILLGRIVFSLREFSNISGSHSTHDSKRQGSGSGNSNQSGARNVRRSGAALNINNESFGNHSTEKEELELKGGRRAWGSISTLFTGTDGDHAAKGGAVSLDDSFSSSTMTPVNSTGSLREYSMNRTSPPRSIFANVPPSPSNVPTSDNPSSPTHHSPIRSSIRSPVEHLHSRNNSTSTGRDGPSPLEVCEEGFVSSQLPRSSQWNDSPV